MYLRWTRIPETHSSRIKSGRARLQVVPPSVTKRCGFQPLRFVLEIGKVVFATGFVLVIAIVSAANAQSTFTCACGKNPPGPPPTRSLKPYTGAPEDLRPFAKFTTPYHEYYQDLIQYNGAARDIPDPDLKDLTEIR